MKISTQQFLFKSATILAWSLAATSQANPCETTLRSARITIHSLATNFLPSEFRSNFTVIGDGYSPSGYTNANLIWSRDRFPIRVELPNGRVKLLQYASLINAYQWPYYDGGSSYVMVSPPKDAPINAKSYMINGKLEWIQVETLPLILAGGNLQLGDDFLLVGEKTFQENARSLNDWCSEVGRSISYPVSTNFRSGLGTSGYRARSKDEVKNLLAINTGITPQRIFEMPWMPGERTGHVDQYVGKLTAKTLVIPQIPQAFIDRLSMNHEKIFATSTTRWLDEQAATLTSRGIRVLRLPMLPPRNLKPSALSPLGWDAQFPSTVNFIVDGQQIYIPDFPTFAGQLSPEVENQIRMEISATLAAEGFKVSFVNSEELLQYNGLLHCISGEI